MSRRLFSDDDELIEEEEEEVIIDEFYEPSTSGRSIRTRRKRSPRRRSPPVPVSGHTPSPGRSILRPPSKYDYRPRNVEFDGVNFVPSQRRGGVVGGSVSISEYESSSGRVLWNDEVEGRTMTAVVIPQGSQGSGVGRWLLGMEWWKLVVFGCVLGLVFGVGYRGLRGWGLESSEGELFARVLWGGVLKLNLLACVSC